MEKAKIEVNVPSILSDCTGGRSQFWLEASTLDEALSTLNRAYPLLRVHLYDEAGRTRRHVLIFHNGVNVASLEPRQVALRPGDQLQVVQAVSGG